MRRIKFFFALNIVSRKVFFYHDQRWIQDFLKGVIFFSLQIFDFFSGGPNRFSECPQNTIKTLFGPFLGSFWIFLTKNLSFFGARFLLKLVYIGTKGAFGKI